MSSAAKRRSCPGAALRRLGAGALAVALVPGVPAAQGQDVAEGSAAAAIREASHPCGHVIDMERFREGVVEGLVVWNVRCDSGRFKVTFKGDTGSTVQLLD